MIPEFEEGPNSYKKRDEKGKWDLLATLSAVILSKALHTVTTLDSMSAIFIVTLPLYSREGIPTGRPCLDDRDWIFRKMNKRINTFVSQEN